VPHENFDALVELTPEDVYRVDGQVCEPRTRFSPGSTDP